MPLAPPTDVLFARGQMAYSLGFHIVFAAVGIAMPLLMVIAEVAWRRTRDPEYLALARRWAKGTAVFFAIGAVSGTALSFELGLLFPTFMRHAGPLIGLPFSLEGFAFFTEAIFLGIYLYGRDRVSGFAHVASGVVVAVSGVASAAFVTLVNAWMNAPRGFTLAADGSLVDIDPVAAMASPFALHEILHTVLASYLAVTLAVAAIPRAGRPPLPGRAGARDRAGAPARRRVGVRTAPVPDRARRHDPRRRGARGHAAPARPRAARRWRGPVPVAVVAPPRVQAAGVDGRELRGSC